MNRHFHPFTPIDPDQLIFASGVTSLCDLLGFSICDPGDALLFSRPCYQAFVADFGSKAKVECEYASFGDVDQFSISAVAKYEEALEGAKQKAIKIKALMLVHPHNPLGKCYTREALMGLMELCQKYKIHLLSDEIYALSVYEVPDDPKAIEFESILSLDTDRYIEQRYLHVLYGMSKDTAAGGIRLGCFYTRNKELMAAMSSVTQFHWSGIANERVATSMLEDEECISAKETRRREYQVPIRIKRRLFPLA